MKKYVSLAMLGLVCGGVLLQTVTAFADEPATNDDSKVTAAVGNGGMTVNIIGNDFEGKDAHFGILTIGDDIPDVIVPGLIDVLDHSGGDGWSLAVKNLSYTDDETLNVKLETETAFVDLTSNDELVATGVSRLAPSTGDGVFSATWGHTPSSTYFHNVLEWTLTPGMTVPPVDLESEQSDGHTFIVLIGEGAGMGKKADVWGEFTKNSDGTLTLVKVAGDVNMSSRVDIVVDIKIPDLVDGIKVTEIGSKAFLGDEFANPPYGSNYHAGGLKLPIYLEVLHDQALGNLLSAKDVWLPNTIRHIGESATAPTEFIAEGFENLKTIGNQNYGKFKMANGNLDLSSLESADEYGEFLYVEATGDVILGDKMKTAPILKNTDDGISNGDESTRHSGSIVIPEGVEIIPDRAFQNANFTGVLSLPTSLKRVEHDAFVNSQFTDVENPNDLERNNDSSVDGIYEKSIRLKNGLFYQEVR